MRFVREQTEAMEKIDYPTNREADFDEFWSRAHAKVLAHDPAPILREAGEHPLSHVRILDARFHGLDGTPVAAWVLLPREADAKNPVPAALYFHGGGGSRGTDPYHWLALALSGYAVVAPEFRNQSGITGSVTPLKRCVGDSFACYNLDGPPDNYYFYHVFTDQMVVARAVMAMPEVDARRVAVMGVSQGGGTSMVVAAVDPEVAFCLPMAPSYCAWERRVYTRTACAAEIARYIERHPDRCEDVFRLLSYFDALNFADRIRCPVVMSCGLKDALTPPDCVYAGFNRIVSPKEMLCRPFGGHTGEGLPVIIRALKQHL